ncbi:MAG TPA: zf-HC2 domain-containing protein [Longimicrobiales bacterium]|nr:zf-HC2 domain-containing protein [Longimicrobiales bacterium]
MNDGTCERFRDRLVDHLHRDLDALEAAETQAHVDRCGDCAAELDLLRGLGEARRSAPPGFAEGVLAAHDAAARATDIAAFREGGRGVALHPVTRPAWLRGLPLAAALAGVLLVGAVVVRGGFGPDAVPAEDAELLQEVGLAILPWPGDDGVIAGAPSLDALTDAEIEALLEELES